MNYLDELARLTESVRLLERQREYMLRDRELLRELEFEKRCNALLDEFGLPVTLLLEVVLGRHDVPDAIRKGLTKVCTLEVSALSPSPSPSPIVVVAEEPPQVGNKRPARENAAEWHRKFGHRSLQSWFNKDA